MMTASCNLVSRRTRVAKWRTNEFSAVPSSLKSCYQFRERSVGSDSCGKVTDRVWRRVICACNDVQLQGESNRQLRTVLLINFAARSNADSVRPTVSRPLERCFTLYLFEFAFTEFSSPSEFPSSTCKTAFRFLTFAT